MACLVFLGMAFSFIKFISSSETLTKREAAILKICPTQEGGVNLLAQLGDSAADDLSHYDVTSELVREISMAAKR